MQKSPTAKSKQSPKPNDPEQSKRFEETARELEVDETGQQFDNAFRVIAPSLPKPKKKDGA